MDSQSPPTLRTERLLLTPVQLTDAPTIQRLFPHWEVVRYLDRRVPWPYPADGALVYVRDVVLPAMARGEEWHWMIRLAPQPDDAIGNISLFDQPGNHRGFWLAPAWQGQGYMSEACEAVSRFWFQTLGRPLMQVPKAISNEGSRRISEREGMRLVGRDEGHFVSGVLPRETWELTREEWLARHADD
ncbi:GNAT family N-acetyltransferase [Pseudomonas sp. YH-1]|uniref:GNAT family N-acetyltransferase n=1 Tax=Pseudomonas sp. YH-1 TaxID=3384787 RepID=UPI003F7CF631